MGTAGALCLNIYSNLCCVNSVLSRALLRSVCILSPGLPSSPHKWPPLSPFPLNHLTLDATNLKVPSKERSSLLSEAAPTIALAPPLHRPLV